MSASEDLKRLSARVARCRRCPRLVEWRERVAKEKRAAYRDWQYWGRPVPGFGDVEAWLLIVGLAPAAHGANRTGRMFTGDRSGDFLYGALHRTGFASRAESIRRDDGLELRGAFITASVRCAPPANRPLPEERRNCREYLERELDLLERVRVIVALGGYAYDHVLRLLRDRGHALPSPAPKFGHGSIVVPEDDGPRVIASYHPSQQNTFTGKLTAEMLDSVFRKARSVGGFR